MANAVTELTELISKMPGIGPRQARRVVQFLLRSDPSYRNKLTVGIKELSEHVFQCVKCYRFDEINNGKLCALCAKGDRDHTALMVVEKDIDIETVENADVYRGYYFVLGSLIPLARQRKNAIEPRSKELENRIRSEGEIKEVVLAFATTPEGDFTAQELMRDMKKMFPNVTFSQLGRGLSLGAEIEYADQETLRNAFQGRH